MRLNSIVFVMSLLHTLTSSSQPTVGGIAGKGMDMNPTFGGFISTMDLTDYSPVGSTYLFEDWSEATVTLKSNGTMADISVMINLLENEIDFKDKEVIRTFSMEHARFIDIKFNEDSTVRYFSHLEFHYSDSTPYVGLMKIVSDSGKWRLVERKYIKVFKSTYIQALDSGPKQDRYEISSDWFLLRNDVLYPIPNRLCTLGQTIGIKENEGKDLCRFSKEKKLSSKSEADLRMVTAWLNKSAD